MHWQRAKRWITSPAPWSMKEKKDARPIDPSWPKDNAESWAIGYQDECWWSRVALPALHSFSAAGQPLRLVEQSVAKDDPTPKLSPATGSMCRSSNKRGYALWRGVR